MKRHALLLTLLGLLLMTTAKAQDGLDRSSIEVINDMAPGWNLGNTLEGVATWAGVDFLNNKGGLGAETAWQGTKTTQAIIDYVKSLGFKSVRIPCAWAYGHISNADTYEIDSHAAPARKPLNDDADDADDETDKSCCLIAELLDTHTSRETHKQIGTEVAVVANHGHEVGGSELVFHNDPHRRTEVRHEGYHCKQGYHHDDCTPLFLLLSHKMNYEL